MKKKKHFYTHVIQLESLYVALDTLSLTAGEKNDLINIMENNIHHVVVDTVLSQLSDKDKKLFLERLHSDSHDEIWNLLHTKIDQIEKKIQLAVSDIVEQLHKDIQEVKKRHE